MRINSNLSSLRAVGSIKTIATKEEENSMKLSSADRIYKSALDPAGLAISEGMRAKITSQMQAKRNANQGVSIFQVAESSVATVQSVAIRLKELAIQASSDTIGDEDRVVLNTEAQELRREADRIANSTSYNNLKLLGGHSKNYQVQVGTKDSSKNNVFNFDAGRINVSAASLGIDNIDLSTNFSARKSLDKFDGMISKLNSARTEIGSVLTRIGYAVQNLDTAKINTSDARSQIRDADMAMETADRAKLSIRKNAATITLQQSNNSSKSVLSLLS